MLSILVAILVGMLASGIAAIWLVSFGWIWTIGISFFVIASILINRFFGKKLKETVDSVQSILQESQQETHRMINRFQNKPMGSQKLMEKQIEKNVENGVLEALELLDKTKPIQKWSLLAERQINTLKMQLFFQIKKFDEVDKLLPKTLILEPLTMAMKMTRQYHVNSPDLEKTFRKGVKKFKYEKATLIYSLYAWILIKRKEVNKALEILAEAKDKIEDEMIQRNWQHVANNKVHLFSNAGLGEQWYALHLEKPAKQKVSKGYMKKNPMMPKGKRRRF